MPAYLTINIGNVNLEFPDKRTRDKEFAEIMAFFAKKGILSQRSVGHQLIKSVKRQTHDDMMALINKVEVTGRAV